MKNLSKRVRHVLLLLPLLAALAVLLRPAVHLLLVWWSDPPAALEAPAPGSNDQSRLNANRPAQVIGVPGDPTAARKQLAELVRTAARDGRQITISGARHSMGGHTLHPGALVLDMQPFRGLALDEKRRILTAGSGARWSEVIPFLDRHGLAVAVMQSNNDFTVGGSISVNCHGWQHDSPPIASTVDAFRLLTASGDIVTCSRTRNPELFRLALGGYGLFGVILDVDLRVVPNVFYKAESHKTVPKDYARVYRELMQSRSDAGMAYGRISVAPNAFLSDARITLLRTQETGASTSNTLGKNEPGLLKRLIFRGSVGSDYGKNLRWQLETLVGETGGQILSRNEIMNEPSEWFANRDPNSTEILQEYFIPAARLADFVEKARSILLRRKPDLLNITVRNVKPDPDTFLCYARQEVFGLVMLFHQGIDSQSESKMQDLTRELIDAALRCDGAYYLPYRLHATAGQFNRAYPMAAEFFALKRKYDPSGIFENRFSMQYGH